MWNIDSERRIFVLIDWSICTNLSPVENVPFIERLIRGWRLDKRSRGLNRRGWVQRRHCGHRRMIIFTLDFKPAVFFRHCNFRQYKTTLVAEVHAVACVLFTESILISKHEHQIFLDLHRQYDPMESNLPDTMLVSLQQQPT